jgi:hypothetical protein
MMSANPFLCFSFLQVDFHTDDPIEIIKRLMIGSEGTLGFVSQVGSSSQRWRAAGGRHCLLLWLGRPCPLADLRAALPPPQVTYNTVPEWPHKASAFVVFPDVMSACQGASGARQRLLLVLAGPERTLLLAGGYSPSCWKSDLFTPSPGHPLLPQCCATRRA